MNHQVQLKQFLGQVKGARDKGLDDDLLSLDGDSDHFGNWSRNAMAAVRTKKAKPGLFTSDKRHH